MCGAAGPSGQEKKKRARDFPNGAGEVMDTRARSDQFGLDGVFRRMAMESLGVVESRERR